MFKLSNYLRHQGDPSIIKLVNGYYQINIPDDVPKIFCYKNQAFDHVIVCFNEGFINGFQVECLVDLIEKLPIPFMWHPADFSVEETSLIEEEKKLNLLESITRAKTIALFQAIGRPQVGWYQLPCGTTKAYILLSKYRQSGLFTNFEDGKREVDKFFASVLTFLRDDYEEILHQLADLYNIKRSSLEDFFFLDN